MTVTCIPGPTTGLYSKPFHIQLSLLIKSKGKVAPIHNMKVYRQGRHIAPLILHIGTEWRLTSLFGCFSAEERRPLNRRIVDLRASLEILEKINLMLQLGFKSQSIQPIV
jgi:hypothetical protein